MEKYCKFCGKELQSGSYYCGDCSQHIDQKSNKSARNIPENDYKKNRLMNELARELDYFNQMRLEYDTIDGMNKSGVNSKANSLLIQVIIGFIFVALLEIITPGVSVWFLWLPFLAFVIISVFWMYKNWKKQNEYSDIEDELFSYYQAFEGAIVSYEYSNPNIIESLISNISSGRATTLEESINCLREDLHREQMMINQEAIARQANDAAIIATHAYINSLKK